MISRTLWLSSLFLFGGTATAKIELYTPVTVPAERVTPLASVWKLFSYSYLLENGIHAAPYLCQGTDPDERFCCEKGKSIGAEEAVARSCGLFFEQTMKQISAVKWNDFWKKKGVPYAWMRKEHLRDHRKVSVKEILAVLEVMKTFPTHGELRADLGAVWTKGTLKDALPQYGVPFFAKTWTWGNEKKKKFIGGMAGWDQKNTSFWVSGEGTSREIMLSDGKAIISQLDPHSVSPEKVRVNFFTKYPVKAVTHAENGSLRIGFENGNHIVVPAHAHLTVEGKKVSGIFDREEYVARVLEREGSTLDGEASKALAVLIRTYLVDHAKRSGETLEIDDHSGLQRVSPVPPAAEARAIADFTSGLVLEGKSPGHNTDLWARMRTLAKKKLPFTAILSLVAPAAKIAFAKSGRKHSCERLSRVEQELRRSLPRWERELVRHPGYEHVDAFEVCRMNHPVPYSDLRNNRIYLSYDGGPESRTTLAHEYLHLGFKNRPETNDEQFIETLARKLTGVNYE